MAQPILLTKPVLYLSRLALHKQINALVLLFQYQVQLALELLRDVVSATRHRYRFALAGRRALLDEVLDVVIIDVVYSNASQ